MLAQNMSKSTPLKFRASQFSSIFSNKFSPGISNSTLGFGNAKLTSRKRKVRQSAAPQE